MQGSCSPLVQRASSNRPWGPTYLCVSMLQEDLCRKEKSRTVSQHCQASTRSLCSAGVRVVALAAFPSWSKILFLRVYQQVFADAGVL